MYTLIFVLCVFASALTVIIELNTILCCWTGSSDFKYAFKNFLPSLSKISYPAILTRVPFKDILEISTTSFGNSINTIEFFQLFKFKASCGANVSNEMLKLASLGLYVLKITFPSSFNNEFNL